MAKTRGMSESHLHAVVTAVATAGSEQLARRAAAGAAVPFELVEAPAQGGGAPMFSYRPLTLQFVEEHLGALRTLDAWATAVNLLAGFDRLGDYLRARGERHVPIDPRERAERTLVVLLAAMHADTGDFLVTTERTATAADALARVLFAGQVESVVVVPLLGVRLQTPRLELQEGLTLLRDDIIDGLPRAARSGVKGRPGTLAVVTALGEGSTSAAVLAARPQLLALLGALRLYDRPAPALAPMAWARTRGGGWASHPFHGTFARASGVLELAADDVDGLRGFADLLAAMPFSGPAAWAARRHELACERGNAAEALTDVLLGLRALLPIHAAGPSFPERVAELCAQRDERDELRGRVELAEALELAAIQGTPYERAQVAAISEELRWHLRSLLRDIGCGHLPADLDDVEPSSPSHRAVEPASMLAAAAVEQVAAIEPEPQRPTAPVAVPEPVAEPARIAVVDTRPPAMPVLGDPGVGTEELISAVTPLPSAPAVVAEARAAATMGTGSPTAELDAIDDALADIDIDITDTRTFADPARDFTPAGEPFEEAFLRSLSEGPEPLGETQSMRVLRGRVSRPRVRRRGR